MYLLDCMKGEKMYTKKVNLSELITVRTESEIEGNFTSVRGEYYVPSINKTGFYKENAHEYIHALEALDSKFREVVSNSNSKTIYFGGRFAMSYFAHEYDLNYVAAFDSCQAKSEPSAKLIVKIIDMMRSHSVKIVLHEEMTDPKAARIIAEEIDGEALLLHSCHNVSKAEMEAGATYLSLMEQNVANLQRALTKQN